MIFRNGGHKDKIRTIPEAVCDYMHRKFIMSPGYIEMLRCFEKDCVINGEKARGIYIFDPRRARKQHITIKCWADMEAHPDLLIFKGHTDQQGKVYLADRRIPTSILKAGINA